MTEEEKKRLEALLNEDDEETVRGKVCIQPVTMEIGMLYYSLLVAVDLFLCTVVCYHGNRHVTVYWSVLPWRIHDYMYHIWVTCNLLLFSPTQKPKVVHLSYCHTYVGQ